jgi:hypothetical protein
VRPTVIVDEPPMFCGGDGESLAVAHASAEADPAVAVG